MTGNNHMQVFDQARVLYREYGTVRGNAKEFANFKQKHKDWREVLLLLEPAIEQQALWRAKIDRWWPPWKNFQGWISGGHWEDSRPACTYSDGESPAKIAERKKADARRLYTTWLSDPGIPEEEKIAWAKQNDMAWLVDEITAKELK